MIKPNSRFDVLTPNGWQTFSGVQELYKQTLVIKFTNGEEINTSLSHSFIINDTIVKASSLKPSTKFNENLTVVSVKLSTDSLVYDLLDVGNGNIFYHDNGIVSHNCEFLGSSRQLLKPHTMATLSHRLPVREFKDEYEGLKIYQEPKPAGKYTMTVDVSRGRHLDSSAFMLFDVSDYPHRIVASYNNNDISPLRYAALIHTIARQYNEAYILVEINDIGAQVADELYYTYEYENLYWSKGGDILGKKGADPYPGIRTTKKTKRIGCANLKDIIENQQLIVDDFLAISELSTFVQADSGVYAADEGFHDDAVMCLVMFAWLVSQPWFKDLFDRNMRDIIYSEMINGMEDALLLGEFSDGRDSYESAEEAGLRGLLH